MFADEEDLDFENEEDSTLIDQEFLEFAKQRYQDSTMGTENEEGESILHNG